MSCRAFFLVAIGWAIAANSGLQAQVINFDDTTGGLPPVALPDNYSPYATFSTEPGAHLLVFSGAGFVGTSAPNNLTAGFDPNGPNYDADLYVDFTQPVNDLTFNIAADNDSDVIAKVNVFYGAGESASLDVIGNAVLSDAIPMDLTSYPLVSRLEIVDITDEFGLAYDDFVFNVADNPIPEPTSLALLASALLMVGHVSRRSR